MRPSKQLLIILSVWLGLASVIAVGAIFEPVVSELTSLITYAKLVWLWSGVFLAVIAFIDMFTLISIHGLEITREVPKNIAVGSQTKVTLTLRNKLPHTRKVFVTDHYPKHSEAKRLPQTIELKNSQNAETHYTITINQRGDATFGNIRSLINSRLKLWQRIKLFRQLDTVKVYPNFAAIHHYLLLSADQQTSQMGIRLSQRRGDGLEFHQLREYRIGDSLRQIDWRASSRLNKLISKEYQEEKDQNIVFLLDCGRRMRTKDDALSHFDHSLNASLLLSYIGLKQGDAVGLQSFGGFNRWLLPQKGTYFINQLLNQVYDIHPTLHASDYVEAATELNKRIRKRSLVVLVTNCRDDDWPELKPAIRLLNQHHLVLLANLREQSLDKAIEENVVDFNSALKYAESTHFLHARQKTMNQCANEGVLAIDTTPEKLATDLVNQYFKIKRSGKL
ncbi:MAG: DUF58 domain-containing protein [Gammaproteobacteria bacterium]|nr:DUF58 domain-containing protein [Gammaproteobacteria bacterium]